MTNYSNIENSILLIAETYKVAVIDNVNMRLAIASLEVIRNACSKESETTYRNAIQLEPGISQYYNDLGIVYFEQKDFKNAIDFYNKAIELDAYTPVQHENLALCFKEMGELTKSQLAYKKADDLKINNSLTVN